MSGGYHMDTPRTCQTILRPGFFSVASAGALDNFIIFGYPPNLTFNRKKDAVHRVQGM
jgi:hypothetical protein